MRTTAFIALFLAAVSLLPGCAAKKKRIAELEIGKLDGFEVVSTA